MTGRSSQIRNLPSRRAGVLAFTGLLLSIAAPGITEAKAPKSSAKDRWAFVEGDTGDGIPKCLIFGKYGRAIFHLMADAKHYPQVFVGVASLDWSIKEGDHLGEIELSSSTDTLKGEPIAEGHGFVYLGDKDEAARFFKSPGPGFNVEREGEVTARFPSSNLPALMDKFLACESRLHARDPFASTAEP